MVGDVERQVSPVWYFDASADSREGVDGSARGYQKG
jgi:hypothetical protein